VEIFDGTKSAICRGEHRPPLAIALIKSERKSLKKTLIPASI
jgi:hypothetical protein